MRNKIITTALPIVWLALCFSVTASAQGPQNNRDGQQELPTVDEIFEMMDENEDALLTKKEIKGPLRKDFDKIDLNEDGFISKEELEKAPKPERPEGGPQGRN